MKTNSYILYIILTLILVSSVAFNLIKSGDSKLENVINEFPTMSGNNLNREEVTIPMDVNDKPLLVILAFQQYHQKTVDDIINQVESEVDREKINIIETPILEGSSKLFQIYLDGIMRGGIPDYDIRGRTITIYGTKESILNNLKINDSNVYWYLVEQDSSNILLNGMNILDQKQLSKFKTLIEN